MRSACLLGSDHGQPAAISGIAQGPAAIAISRGGAAKVYQHAEPNEDCAGYAYGPGGVLLAVADGHSGSQGAEAAVAHVLEYVAPTWCAADPPQGVWHELGYEALRGANAAIGRDATSRKLAVAPTTLAIALARPREDRLSVAAVGDSHIFRIDAEGATELGWQTLGRENPHYLGPEEETWHRPNAVLSETPLSGTRCLVLVTDGLSEPGIGVDDPAAVLAAASSEARSVELARRPQWLARRIVELAQESHRRHRSGDNVAAAVLWSETRRR